ncbi:MAG: hypothetical protein ABI599_13640 [Flavobacteriales bacterium]
MASRKRASIKRKEVQDATTGNTYDLRTPLWELYYRRVRATVRFPRYYKKAVNW